MPTLAKNLHNHNYHEGMASLASKNKAQEKSMVLYAICLRPNNHSMTACRISDPDLSIPTIAPINNKRSSGLTRADSGSVFKMETGNQTPIRLADFKVGNCGRRPQA